MSLQTVGAIVCVFLAQVAADTGVHFVMERHPDSYFCGHLQCAADLTKSDQDVSTFVEMAIYDITRVNSELKLASVSTFHPDLYVDTTKSSALSCTGIISRLQANLTLKLRHDIDCLYGVYKCQLDMVTESGHSEVLTKIVIPEHNDNYTRVAKVVSHIDELFNIHTTLVSNQTTVINKLESHLVDITSQLMNQTKEINRQEGRFDNQTIKLMDQTAEINKLGSRLDHQTIKLMDQTAEINKLGSRLDHQTIKLTDQTAEINKLGSRLDHQTTKLMNQTEEISKQGSRLDNQTTKLTDQTAEINKLGSRLDHQTTKLINQTEEISKQGSRLDNQIIKLTDQTAEINKLGSRLDHQTTKLMNQTGEISKQGSRLDHQTTKLTDQTAEINKLGSRLDHQTIKLMDQTAEINKLGSRLDHQTIKLTDQTAEINKLGSRLDHQTTKLMNQTGEISKQGSRLDNQTTKLTDQTAEINKLGSRVDDLTVQLINQRAQLYNMSQRQKQQHDVVEKRFTALDLKLDTIQKLLRQMSYKPLGSVCYRDMPHINTREKFLLYGNVPALCDTETDGGGWVVIQRRVRGDVDFYRGWDAYKRGFGTIDTDFWIGNDIIHNLTSQDYNELRIDFVYNGTDYFAQYTNFSVADESSNYRITIGGYSGNTYDSMGYHNGRDFSTPDRDNDLESNSCSVTWHGSWWYNKCYRANLNGVWAAIDKTGISWKFNSTYYWRPLTFTEMKIRHI